MKRRSLLLASAAVTLPACSPPSGPAPQPVIPPGPTLSGTPPTAQLAPPPGPDAVPRSFRVSASWPSIDLETRVTALHQHHFCGAVLRGEKDALSHPVVVDARTHTTRVVHSTPDGAFTTREVELAFLRDQLPLPPGDSELGPLLTTGPAVLDDEHAHLVVARPHAESSADDIRGVLHLVKVALADGTVTASALLSEDFSLGAVPAIHLDPSADGASLLVAGLNPGGDFVGLRLDANDLSVQFDAHSVVPDGVDDIRLAGEALEVSAGREESTLVLLADGREVPAPGWASVVIGQWCYYGDNPKHLLLRDLTTGEDTPLPDLGGDAIFRLNDRSSFPRVWSRQPLLASTDAGHVSVSRPGEASPLLRWDTQGRGTFEGCATWGDVLYTTNLSMAIPTTLRSLSSGEVLGTVPWLFTSGDFAVNAWGGATAERFLPADDWF